MNEVNKKSMAEGVEKEKVPVSGLGFLVVPQAESAVMVTGGSFKGWIQIVLLDIGFELDCYEVKVYVEFE